MKFFLVTLLLATTSYAFSQTPKERANSLLSDKIGSFDAVNEAETKVINDGSTRIERQYVDGNKKLEIRITIPKGKEAIEKVQGEMQELVSMFKEMSNEGKIEFFDVTSGDQTGALTFSEERGNVFIQVYNRFVIQITAKGFTSFDELKTFYLNLDLSVLQKAKG